MVRLRFLLILVTSTLVAACSDAPARQAGRAGDDRAGRDGGHDAGRDAGEQSRSLCPTCAALSPTEPDEPEEEDTPLCTPVRRKTVDRDDDTLGFAPREVLAFVEKEFDVPMHWGVAREYDPSLRTSPLWPTGYDEDTRVRFALDVTALHTNQTEPLDAGPAAANCFSWLELEATLSLETDDGAVRGRFEHVVLSAYNAHYVDAFATAPLREFEGLLDLHSSKSPHDGTISLQLWLRPDSVRGVLHPQLFYERPTDDQNAAHAFEGYWPVDACVSESVPVKTSQAPVALEGRELGDVLSEARKRVMDANPLAAISGSSQVDVTFSVGAQEQACMTESPYGGPFFDIPAMLRVQTSDHHLDTEQRGLFRIEMDGGELETVVLSFTSSRVPASQFAEKLGIEDVDLGTWPCGQLRYEAVYYMADPFADAADDSSPLLHGEIEVDGVTCPDKRGIDGHHEKFFSWCSKQPCPVSTRPRL